MISRIVIENFKNLVNADLSLGAMNLIIGPNGSGKSAVCDALRVIQGAAMGLTLNEMLNGKPATPSMGAWGGIRGGASLAGHRDRQGSVSGKTFIAATAMINGKPAVYGLGFNAIKCRLTRESLCIGKKRVYDSGDCRQSETSPGFKVQYNAGKIGRANRIQFESHRPVLGQLGDHPDCSKEHRRLLFECMKVFSDMAFIDPSPVPEEIFVPEEEKEMKRFGEWCRQIRPVELNDVFSDERQCLMAMIGNAILPVSNLSEGARRFLAVISALIKTPRETTCVVRGIEKHLSPSRVRQLYEILKSQAGKQRQIIATSHSPIVLSWVDEADYPTTYLCGLDERSGEADIRSLDQSEEFAKLVKRRPIGNLFAEEWLEGSM